MTVKICKLISTILLSVALTFSFNAFAARSTSFSPAQVKDIQKIVHDYLIKNPGVLVQASKVLQKRAAKKQLKTVFKAINKKQETDFQKSGNSVRREFARQCGLSGILRLSVRSLQSHEHGHTATREEKQKPEGHIQGTANLW